MKCRLHNGLQSLDQKQRALKIQNLKNRWQIPWRDNSEKQRPMVTESVSLGQKLCKVFIENYSLHGLSR